MGRSSSGRSRAGSELSSKNDRYRDEQETTSSHRHSRADSTTSSTPNKRKSSQRGDVVDDEYVSTSARKDTAPLRDPYQDDTTPSKISSNPIAYNDRKDSRDRPLQREDSENYSNMVDRNGRHSGRKESRTSDKNERSRAIAGSDDERRNVGRSDSDRNARSDFKKSSKSDRRQTSWAIDEHVTAQPENQFYGSAQPYLPGYTADYHGDHGESVLSQPSFQPDQQRIVVNPEYAHVSTPAANANPPFELSGLGHVGAAASYFNSNSHGNEYSSAQTPTRNGSLSARLDQPDAAQSGSRAGPEVQGQIPSSEHDIGTFRPPGAPGVPGARVGEAASYYMNHQQYASDYQQASSTQHQYSSGQTSGRPQSMYTAPPQSSQHGRPQSTGHSYGVAAAAGLAGAAAGTYLASHHGQQSDHTTRPTAYNVNVALDQNQAAYPGMQQQRHKHKHRGPITKLVDWFRDPNGVAEFEAYTEAIGVCKYCFDPNSSPADAPRRHHYRGRPSGSRHGSTIRVDKLQRYSSDEDRRRKSSGSKKLVASGIAGLGAAAVGEALFKQKHDFDDTYSVKSGRHYTNSQVGYNNENDKYAIRKSRSRQSLNGDSKSSRRDDGGKVRRESGITYDKRSSKRRSSSSSSSSEVGLTRGGALSVGVGAAGLAMAAEAAHRRRSRSRSPSKRSYYTKRVSPKHSYVDLTNTNQGSVGFGTFFSSPSANKKKGKKSKGLFLFSNASSSSSDADLAFGEGTVRRKDSKRSRTDKAKRRKDSDTGTVTTAAILGLAATGAALAAESDKHARNGRGRDHNDERANRKSNAKIALRDHDTTTTGEHDDVWEDASDGESAGSVDTALAYGSRLSAAQSRESLTSNDGTSKWAWRWNKKKDKQDQKDQREHKARRRPTSDQVESGSYDPFISPATGAAMGVAAIGVAAAALSHEPSPSTLPPMKVIDPMPTSEPAPVYEMKQMPSRFDPPIPQNIVSASPLPLQQPQPVDGRVGELPWIAPISESPVDTSTIRRERRSGTDFEDREPPKLTRRNSSPTTLPSFNPSTMSKSSVTFRLTEEQLLNEQRVRDKEEKRRRRREEKERRRTTDLADLTQKQADPTAEKPRRASVEIRSSREAEIDAELERLYAEHKKQEAERTSQMEGDRGQSQNETNVERASDKRSSVERVRDSSSSISMVAAAIAAATGVGAAALVRDGKQPSESEEERKPRRRSSLKKSTKQTPPPIEPPAEIISSTSQSMTQRVASAPSPVHEDYSKFFTPIEISEHLKEHNDAAEHRDDAMANFIEVVPGGPAPKLSTPFDAFLYQPFGLDPDHDPLGVPWRVPMLGLVEPTPPHSRVPSIRSEGSPLVRAQDVDSDVDVPRERASSVGSRVTWGDHDTYVYEVETPEYERSNPTDIFAAANGDQTSSHRPHLGRVYTLDEDVSDNEPVQSVPPVKDMTPQQQEHLSLGKDFRNLPPGDTESPEIIIEQHEPSPDPSPVAEADLEDLLMGNDFYQRPFVETVSDIGLGEVGAVPAAGSGFVESLPATPAEESTHPGVGSTEEYNFRDLPESMIDAPRVSSSERRRKERAMSSADTVPTVHADTTPASIDNEHQDRMPGGFEPEEPTPRDITTRASTPPAPHVASFAAMKFVAQAAASAANKQRRGSEVYVPLPESVRADEDQEESRSRASHADPSDEPIETFRKSSSKLDYSSDPEDWERKSSKIDDDIPRGIPSPKRDVDSALSQGFAGIAVGAIAASVISEADYYANEKDASKKRKSKRGSEIFDDYEARSVVSMPATKDEDRQSRRRSKRDGDYVDDDDDTRSFTSVPVGEEEKKRRRKSKRSSEAADNDNDAKSVVSTSSRSDGKLKEKKSGSLFSGLFSSSKSDVSTSSKKSSKSTKHESRVKRDESVDSERRKKRRSKSFDGTDSSRVDLKSAETNGETSQNYRNTTRDQSTDEGFVSAEDPAIQEQMSADAKQTEIDSFLAERPEMPPTATADMPMAIDDVSGLPTERRSSMHSSKSDHANSVSNLEQYLRSHDQYPALPPLGSEVRSYLVENNDDNDGSDDDKVEALKDEEPSLPPQQDSTPRTRPRALSMIRTSDVMLNPIMPSSPTAVPLSARRFPVTPMGAARETMSSPIVIPHSPLTTPRTRQSRPKSTEFSSKEFRPLYLVERHTAKVQTPEHEQIYPSLPSSRTTSANPSVEDLRGQALRDDYFSADHTDIEPRTERRRRSWQDSSDRRHSPDYLDSRSATPVPGEQQRVSATPRDIRERREVPKHLFHSPSELLQDPTFLDEVQEDDMDLRSGSPLPSVVSTDNDFDQEFMSAESRAPSPDDHRRSRSRSRSWSHHETDAMFVAGFGLIGGTALGLASSGRKDSSASENTAEDKSMAHTSKVNPPASSQDVTENEDEEEQEVRLPQSTDLSTRPLEPKLDEQETSETSILSPKIVDDDVTETRNIPDATDRAIIAAADDDPSGGVDQDLEVLQSHIEIAASSNEAVTDSNAQIEPKVEQLESSRDSTRDIGPSVLEGQVSIVSSSEQTEMDDSKLGAFEQAFERAARSRGLAEDVSKEAALEVFLPSRENAPFVPKGDLTPIGEQSTRTTRPSSPATDPGTPKATNDTEEWSLPSKKSKKGKDKTRDKKSKKESKLRAEVIDTSQESAENTIERVSHSKVPDDLSDQALLPDKSGTEKQVLSSEPIDEIPISNKNPFGNDFSISEENFAVLPVPSVDNMETQVTIPDLNPSDNDFSLRKSTNDVSEPITFGSGSSIQAEANVLAVAQSGDAVIKPVFTKALESESTKEQLDLFDEESIDLPGEASREVDLALPVKKDKKKTRKGQLTLEDVDVSTPAESSVATLVKTPADEPFGDEEWATNSSKRGKKGKKGKKDRTSWIDDVIAPVIAGAGIGAGAAAISSQTRENDSPELDSEKMYLEPLSQVEQPVDQADDENFLIAKEPQLDDVLSAKEEQPATSFEIREQDIDLSEEKLKSGQPQAETIQRVPWDFGLSAKQLKKKEKLMRQNGTWQDRLTQDMIDQENTRDINGLEREGEKYQQDSKSEKIESEDQSRHESTQKAVDEPVILDTVVTEDMEIEKEQLMAWDDGLDSRERKIVEKLMRRDGTWDDRITQKMVDAILEKENLARKGADRLLLLETGITEVDNAVAMTFLGDVDPTEKQLSSAPKVAWDYGLNAKQKKKQEKKMRENGTWKTRITQDIIEIAAAQDAKRTSQQTTEPGLYQESQLADLKDAKLAAEQEEEANGEFTTEPATTTSQKRSKKDKKKKTTTFNWAEPSTPADDTELLETEEADDKLEIFKSTDDPTSADTGFNPTPLVAESVLEKQPVEVEDQPSATASEVIDAALPSRTTTDGNDASEPEHKASTDWIPTTEERTSGEIDHEMSQNRELRWNDGLPSQTTAPTAPLEFTDMISPDQNKSLDLSLVSQESALPEADSTVAAVQDLPETTLPDDSEWAMPAKKSSKKDKKKRKSGRSTAEDLSSTLVADQDLSNVSASAVLEQEMVQEPTSSELNAIEAEDEFSWAPTRKSSKKEKNKSKKGMKLDLADVEVIGEQEQAEPIKELVLIENSLAKPVIEEHTTEEPAHESQLMEPLKSEVRGGSPNDNALGELDLAETSTNHRARDLHNAPVHQDWLSGVGNKVSSFPGRPVLDVKEIFVPDAEAESNVKQPLLQPLVEPVRDLPVPSVHEEQPTSVHDAASELSVDPTVEGAVTFAQKEERKQLDKAVPTTQIVYSARELHDAPVHQEWLEGLQTKVSDFPKEQSAEKFVLSTQSLDESDHLKSALSFELAAQDLHSATGHQDWLSGVHGKVSAFPARPILDPISAQSREKDVVLVPEVETATRSADTWIDTEVPERALSAPADETVDGSARQQDDDVSWNQGKKGKKGKKAKLGSGRISETSLPTTPTIEETSRELELLTTSTPIPSEVHETLQNNSRASEENESMDPPISTGSKFEDSEGGDKAFVTPMEGNGDGYFSMRTTPKKSKKDKKDKKKRKSLAWADDELTTPSSERELDSVFTQDRGGGKDVKHEASDALATEDVPFTESSVEPEQKIGADSSNKSLEIPVADRAVVSEANDHVKSVNDSKDVTNFEDQASSAADEKSFFVAVDDEPTQEPDDDWYLPAKKGKKVKKDKKKKKSSAEEINDATVLESPSDTLTIVTKDLQDPAEPVDITEQELQISTNTFEATDSGSNLDNEPTVDTLMADAKDTESAHRLGALSPPTQVSLPEDKELQMQDASHGVGITEAVTGETEIDLSRNELNQGAELAHTARGDSDEQTPDKGCTHDTPENELYDSPAAYLPIIATAVATGTAAIELVATLFGKDTATQESADDSKEELSAKSSVEQLPIKEWKSPDADADEWALLSSKKKSKKDKKKKRQSTLQESEDLDSMPADDLVSSQETPISNEEGVETDVVPADIPIPSEALSDDLAESEPQLVQGERSQIAEVADEGLSISNSKKSKKEKKDKKKKRQVAFEEDNSIEPVTPAEPEPEIPAPEITDKESTRKISEVTTSKDTSLTEEPLEQDDLWVLPGKKSKKDKKKKRLDRLEEDESSGFATPAELQRSEPETSALEVPLPESSRELIESIPQGVELAENHDNTDVGGVLEQDELWALPAKKAKKDKKKKRYSTIEDSTSSQHVTPTESVQAKSEALVPNNFSLQLAHDASERLPQDIALPDIQDDTLGSSREISGKLSQDIALTDTQDDVLEPVHIGPERRPQDIALPNIRDDDVESYQDISESLPQNIALPRSSDVTLDSSLGTLESLPQDIALPDSQDNGSELSHEHLKRLPQDIALPDFQDDDVLEPVHIGPERRPQDIALPDIRDDDLVSSQELSKSFPQNIALVKGHDDTLDSSHDILEKLPQDIALPDVQDDGLESSQEIFKIFSQNGALPESQDATSAASHEVLMKLPEEIALPETQDDILMEDTSEHDEFRTMPEQSSNAEYEETLPDQEEEESAWPSVHKNPKEFSTPLAPESFDQIAESLIRDNEPLDYNESTLPETIPEEEDLWATSSKKKRKDKKKKGKIVFEGTAISSIQPEIPTEIVELTQEMPALSHAKVDIPVVAQPDTDAHQDATIEDGENEDSQRNVPSEPDTNWALPGKKLKKQKKKNRQSTVDEISTDSVTPVKGPHLAEPALEFLDDETQHADPGTAIHIRDDTSQSLEVGFGEEDTPAPLDEGQDEPWGIPIKKSKGSKKQKKKAAVFIANLGEDGSQASKDTSAFATPAEDDSEKLALEPSSINDTNIDTSKTSTKEVMENLNEGGAWDTNFEESKKDKKTKKKKGKLQFDWEEEADTTPATSIHEMPAEHPNLERGEEKEIEAVKDEAMLVDEALLQNPSDIQDKDSRPNDVNGHMGIAETVPQEEEEPVDEWSMPVKKSKKDKKKKRKSNFDINEETITPARSSIESGFYADDDSSKYITGNNSELVAKDKIQRLSLNLIPISEAVSDQPLHHLHEPENTTKAINTSVDDDDADHQVSRDMKQEADHATNLVTDDTAIDNTSGIKDMISAEREMNFLSENHETRNLSRDIDSVEVLEEGTTGDSNVSRKKSKKGKKDKKSKKMNMEAFESAFPDEQQITTSSVEPTSNTGTSELQAEVQHVDTSMPNVDLQQTKSNLIEHAHHSDSGSDVSATTRERRRRRRSPQAWTGEEPDDLPRSPRDRALTPPPDHDDIMDTALGIAAGLGFGASQHTQPAEGPSHVRSAQSFNRDVPTWSFDNVGPADHTSVRDSGVQFEDTPKVKQDAFEANRDSGFVASPVMREMIHHEGDKSQAGLRPPRPRSPTSSTEDVAHSRDSSRLFETPAKRQPSPVESTSKDRDSALFKSSPAMPTPRSSHSDRIHLSSPSELRRVPSVHGRHGSKESLRDMAGSPKARRLSDELSSSLLHRATATEIDRAVFSPSPRHSIERVSSPPKTPLHPIDENTVALGALAMGGLGAVAMMASSRDAPAESRARSLGRSKSRTSSLRNLREGTTSPFESRIEIPPPLTNDRAINPEHADTRDMSDVYDGYGANPGSPRSPTRPPSVRRRQSMQQIADLQSKVEQLASENRSIAEAKLLAERHLEDLNLERNKADFASEEALRTLTVQMREKDEEIFQLRSEIDKLVASHETLRDEHENRYTLLLNEKSTAQAQWQESSRELHSVRNQHAELSNNLEGTVRAQIDAALADKNAEVSKLRRDLEKARDKIRELQSQILARGADDIVTLRDEDYFDNACQQLCEHVRQWVLRFSKFSDTRVCRATHEVRDEKTVDRFDNAILDGSDVDIYLADRTKRRDVFMSVVMTMIWEYVFTRYLFGMDRDQRQKLKQLEKTLTEVGAPSAVHQWRALTLTLLSKRAAFKAQRDNDAEAVTLEILDTLSKFLPPPQNLEAQVAESLRNVMRAAVNLSIEMRTQKAEYIMLPPLQPEYDTNGDLARKVYFNASLMNERSGETTSNDELQENQAVVRMVLFPLVVKKGDDGGSGEEEIVVCPAQVLVARSEKSKRTKSRVVSAGSGGERAQSRMSAIDSRSLRGASTHSLGAMGGVDLTGPSNMF